MADVFTFSSLLLQAMCTESALRTEQIEKLHLVDTQPKVVVVQQRKQKIHKLGTKYAQLGNQKTRNSHIKNKSLKQPPRSR